METEGIPSIWIHAEGHGAADLEAAVRRGGGCPVDDASRAEAIVWAADEPELLRRRLHEGIRWVQLSSAGIEHWFAAGVIDDSRIWTAAKGVYAPPIAEYVVAAIASLARDLPHAMRLRRWQPLGPERIRGTTVGIVGAGLIGEEVIRLLEPFGVETLALTRTGRPVAGASRSLGPDDLETLLATSDYLVLAAPETAETRYLLNAERLSSMKPNAVVINVGRGSILDTDALVAALRGNRIRAAVLDVTDPEPLPEDHPLWQLDNVIITSHTASTQTLGRPLLAQRVEENVRRYRAGAALLGLVDAHAGY